MKTFLIIVGVIVVLLSPVLIYMYARFRRAGELSAEKLFAEQQEKKEQPTKTHGL